MIGYNKVKGHVNLSKNSRSGAVINTNVSDYNNARIRSGRIKLQEDRILNLESDLSEIKQLLQKVVANGNS